MVKPWKVTALPLKEKNQNLVIYEYVLDPQRSQDEIVEIVENLVSVIKDGLRAKGLENQVEGKVLVSLYYDESLGWLSGKQTKFGEHLNFFDIVAEYD
jgi:hypothetical protein